MCDSVLVYIIGYRPHGYIYMYNHTVRLTLCRPRGTLGAPVGATGTTLPQSNITISQ